MDKQNEDMLYILLKEWFSEKGNQKNIYSRSKVGDLIKSKLLRAGHWRALARGDARKGGRMKGSKSNENNQNEIDDSSW